MRKRRLQQVEPHERGEPVEAGMARIERCGPLNQGATVLPVARVRHHAAEAGDRGPVQGIELESPLLQTDHAE